jgi:hypothetical protein
MKPYRVEVTIPMSKCNRAYYRRYFAPLRIEGIKALVIILSKATSDADYIRLLEATYGEDNVDVYGCGYKVLEYVGYGERVKQLTPPYPGAQVLGPIVDYTAYDYLSLNEFGYIVRVISEAGGNYDQVHVLGHGDPFAGLIVRKGRFVEGVPSECEKVTGEMLEKALGDVQWPLNTPGAWVVLAGCDTLAGVLPGYFGRFVPPVNVHVVEGIFNCAGIDFPIKQPDGSIVFERLALDWYHDDQLECIRAIADSLGNQMIKPARPLGRLEVIVDGSHERVYVED